MSVGPVHILSTGVANTASVAAALERAHRTPIITSDARDVARATHLVVPGVGAFGPAMSRLTELNLTAPLKARMSAGKATLCICLGMQILFDSSEESPGVPGLSLLSGQVTRFTPASDCRVPQLGWNQVLPGEGFTAFPAGHAYYANSFRVAGPISAAGWTFATTNYNTPFVAAASAADGRVLACQFHPELSGPWGLALINRWLDHGRSLGPRSSTLAPHSALSARVIPCLDVRDGRVVKGVNFLNLRDAGDPAALALAYEQQGADELVMLDVSATAEARRASLATVRAIRRAISIPLTVGGGVRSVDDAGALLDAGADKVSVNSAAIADPDLLDTLANRFGSQCVVVAIDAATTTNPLRFPVFTHSGTRLTNLEAPAWAAEAQRRGAGEVLLTSINRDGTQVGYDLPLLQAVSTAVTLPVIASGGAGKPADLVEAIKRGHADAVLAASIFHDGRHSIAEVKRVFAEAGIPVRIDAATVGGTRPC